MGGPCTGHSLWVKKEIKGQRGQIIQATRTLEVYKSKMAYLCCFNTETTAILLFQLHEDPSPSIIARYSLWITSKLLFYCITSRVARSCMGEKNITLRSAQSNFGSAMPMAMTFLCHKNHV